MKNSPVASSRENRPRQEIICGAVNHNYSQSLYLSKNSGKILMNDKFLIYILFMLQKS